MEEEAGDLELPKHQCLAPRGMLLSRQLLALGSRHLISPDVEYQFCSTQIRWCSERIAEAFNAYIRLFSAILAGSIFLIIQPNIREQTNTATFAIVSSILVVAAGLVAIITIVETFNSRRNYRKRVTELSGKRADGKPEIELPRSAAMTIEIVMILSILLSAALFIALNPFTLSP